MSQERRAHHQWPVLPPAGEHVQLPLALVDEQVERLAASQHGRPAAASGSLKITLSTCILYT